MILRRLLLPAAIVGLLCVHCLAAEPSSDAISTDNDQRLNQTITLKAESVSVSDVLSQLSTSTGVALTAGQDADDWAVRDRKVIVEVTDMRLIDLMQQLASTLRFRWSRGGDGAKATYRLWQDRKARDEEESLRSSVDSEQSRLAREKRENGLADMVNLGSLAGADAAGLKANDPWRYVLATEPLGRDVADLMSNFSDARNAFVQGTEASFAVAELPQTLQDTVKRIAESYESLMKSIGNAEDHAALLGRFDKLQITINRGSSGGSGPKDIVSQSILGRIAIGSGSDSLEIPLFDPASPVGKALGRAIIGLKGGALKDAVGKQLQADMGAAISVSEAVQAAPRDITSDPALRVSVKIFDRGTAATLPMALKALSAKTKLNVISDCFPGPQIGMDGGERTVGEQLELIRKAFGSNWTKAGGVLVFRDKDWFTKRAWAVPEVWMKYWADRGKLNDGLLLDDLARIGDLRDEQIDHTIMTDSQLVRFGAGEAARNRQILRFYVSLTADQRKRLTESRLDASSLTDEQWAALKSALATKGAAYAAAQKGSQFAILSQSGKDVIEYKFAYYPGENETAVTFTLSTGSIYRTSDEVAFPVAPPKK